jgi:NAD(P)-dependent dehydrogenase (short-subunit alcohol dehydrogenase family)
MPGEGAAALFDLTGKVVFISGATGLLGSAYCEALAGLGARLILTDMREREPEAQAQALQARTGAQVLGVPCDVTRETEVKEAVEAGMRRFGRIDVVLNNAAATFEHLLALGEVSAPFEEASLSVWEAIIRTNLTGPFLIARETGKAMLASGGGSLINVSSIYGVVAPDHRLYEGMPFRSFAAYAASKAGIHGLTLWLSTYWARSNIRVNTLVPGGVFNGHPEEFVRRYSDRTPLGRMADRQDLIGMVVFLAADASRYCTGQQFVVDGGLTAW